MHSQRADCHKVAQTLTSFGKNHQGRHYGFKLHATTNSYGHLCSLWFSGAHFYDAQALPFLVNESIDMLVGDTLYGASVMRKKTHNLFGIKIISPPWPKQNKKVATPFQNFLLSERSRIESVFGILKQQLHIVTSFPRSIRRCFVHYMRTLLGYQVCALMRGK
ncbi:MAG: transposase [Candidatus Moranbacteria bacterium]|nr:transposase [Candidatus Moranbacteria bacterium]